MTIRAFLIAAALLSLGACAPLVAETPLFSPADQIGPAPLQEGTWMFVSEECPMRNARRRGRLPAECRPGELRRLADGAWSFRFQDHVQLSEEVAGPHALRMVIVPVTEQPQPDAYASFYVIERMWTAPVEETPRAGYTVLVPIGELPAREAFLFEEIYCVGLLREGPIDGVAEVVDERGELVRCVASSQAAVREAARRYVLANLNRMLQDDEHNRFVFVRP
jgi:hypothetical protein